MVVEILISAALVLSAAYILYKNIKKSSTGKCSSCRGNFTCSSCCSDNENNISK